MKKTSNEIREKIVKMGKSEIILYGKINYNKMGRVLGVSRMTIKRELMKNETLCSFIKSRRGKKVV